MAQMDLGSGIKVAIAHKADTYNVAGSPHNSTSVDCDESYQALVVVNAGTVGGTLDLKLQDSPDDSAWADVTGATFTQIDSTNDDAVYFARVLVAAVDRYIRAVATVAGGEAKLATTVVLTPNDTRNAGTAEFLL